METSDVKQEDAKTTEDTKTTEDEAKDDVTQEEGGVKRGVEDDVTQEGGGVKRGLEDEEKEKKTEKVDPSKAPDPEEPEKFDESAIKSDFEEHFNPPEDDVTVTLDRCKE